MYTLEQLKGRIIWVFREERSGSNWFIRTIINKLSRTSTFFEYTQLKLSMDDIYYYNIPESIAYYINNRSQCETDAETILNTHEFICLQGLHNYQNPIVIRTSRRNRTEQLASEFISSQTRVFNDYPDVNNSSKNIDIEGESIIIPEEYVCKFVDRKNRTEELWKMYAPKYENETIYYEDMISGCESNFLPFKIAVNDIEHDMDILSGKYNVLSQPTKLRYDYKKIIKNYQEIDIMLKQNLNPVEYSTNA